jgi:hypothetical protein
VNAALPPRDFRDGSSFCIYFLDGGGKISYYDEDMQKISGMDTIRPYFPRMMDIRNINRRPSHGYL